VEDMPSLEPKYLKEMADVISSPLSVFFHKSLGECMASSHRLGNWKHHTKYTRKVTDHGNYKPVSLTSIIGKVMESIIGDNLVHHIMDNQLFCDDQAVMYDPATPSLGTVD
jgi:hypothetical protein